jgi:ABC-type uncharacterized transport system substrate-binding protein
MRRREFMSLLGGAAAAPSLFWPLAARAKQAERMRRVGVLMAFAEDDPETTARVAGFRHGLERLGWSEGRNVRFDYRFARGSADQFQPLAKELVALQPDVILAQSTPVAAVLQRESRVTPIVFINVSDPIGSGFIASVARPGGNLTGLQMYEEGIAGKWFALLKEIAPRLTRAVFIANPKTTAYDYFVRSAKVVASSLAIDLSPSPVETAPDIERVIVSFARLPDGCLILPPDAPPSCTAISLSRSPPSTACPPPTRTAHLSPPAASCPTGSTVSTGFGRWRPTSTASCAAPSRPTFPCRRRPSSRPLSTLKRRKRSASMCRPPCSWPPTR